MHMTLNRALPVLSKIDMLWQVHHCFIITFTVGIGSLLNMTENEWKLAWKGYMLLFILPFSYRFLNNAMRTITTICSSGQTKRRINSTFISEAQDTCVLIFNCMCIQFCKAYLLNVRYAERLFIVLLFLFLQRPHRDYWRHKARNLYYSFKARFNSLIFSSEIVQSSDWMFKVHLYIWFIRLVDEQSCLSKDIEAIESELFFQKMSKQVFNRYL